MGTQMNQHYTYVLVDPFINQPFYVGKGQGYRAYYHEQPCNQKYNPIKAHRIKSIVERGGDIVPQLFFFATEQEAFEYEKELIKQYGKICNGTGILTNLDDGGRGGSSGRPITEAVRAKLKLRKRPGPKSTKGRQRIIDSVSGPKSKEHKYKLQMNCPKATPVIQKETTGKVITTYVSAREAGKQTGIDNSYISQCCRGRYKTAGGFIWEYVNTQKEK